MFSAGICTLFSRISINNVLIPLRSISVNAPLYLNITNVLCAEPLKKKKKVDPALIKHREERRKRRLEKYIRRLEKHAGMLKPIDELELPKKLLEQADIRNRELPEISTEELIEQSLLCKKWNRYKSAQHREQAKLIRLYIASQIKALEKLRESSEKLYLEAIKIDEDLLPYSAKGPVSTPPIKGYKPPDGDYTDISRSFV